MPTMNEILERYREIEQLIEDAEGDITGQEELIDTMYRDLSEQFGEKAPNYVGLIKDLRARGDARKKTAANLREMAERDLRHADFLAVAADKSAIGEALAAGETIPGCRLGERGTQFRIA
jgi:hypothetical protein